ncbi:hypothetical protein PROFUN_09575 [Planoprotostelium fungivorum]|uniref:Diacylglycerol glucosyltransferase N-terminal domain-containing protein n=1 Tax=Planoprotostelium fungivorum TaxID=1890364 RepID=A0A2P6NGR9_9EUKA|nr:hypothetical protein PROFUN_09575 [Planoprotostelium fungivorum]
MTPAEVVGVWRAKKGRKFPSTLLITNFPVHSGWVQPDVSQYFVFNGESKAYLKTMGVPDHLVMVTGMPVDPVFRRYREHRGPTKMKKTRTQQATPHRSTNWEVAWD